MKKTIALLLILIICISNIPVFASTALGSAIYTDVVTYINHFPVPSYNFNGYTLIIAENLVHYGFNVFWNEYSNSLHITRDLSKNDIIPQITFKPLESKLGKKQLTITTTDVRVFSGNCEYSAFGGIDGYTFINVEDLQCIDNVSVTWVPEVNAIKVWITDGLEMRETPFNVRRMDDHYSYYESCYGLDSYVHWQWIDTPVSTLLFFTETIGENSNICTFCDADIRITDVIDANGNSRRKWNNLYSYNNVLPTEVPYFYGYTDYPLSRIISIKNEDLLPNTATEYGGLIKFTYRCDHSNCNGTIKVNCLPYAN